MVMPGGSSLSFQPMKHLRTSRESPMKADIRTSDLYREIEALCRTLRQPGTGQISDAADVHASPDGKHIVFAGAIMDQLEDTPPTRVCTTELTTGATQVLPFGPNCDR